MSSRARWLIVLVVCGCAFVASGQTHRKAQPQTHEVVIRHFMFQPPEVTATVGDTIEWKNEDVVSHTVTAEDGSFDSGRIRAGGTWKLVASKPGTHSYKCLPHPNMHGSLVVR